MFVLFGGKKWKRKEMLCEHLKKVHPEIKRALHCSRLLKQTEGSALQMPEKQFSLRREQALTGQIGSNLANCNNFSGNSKTHGHIISVEYLTHFNLL